jgi:hypothetical protein
MGIDREESGTLLLRKPGKMHWSYSDPAGKIFLLDGKYAWFYSPGDAQVERVSAAQLDDLRSPLRFLLGHTQLQKELDGLTLSSTADGLELSGVPKGDAKQGGEDRPWRESRWDYPLHEHHRDGWRQTAFTFRTARPMRRPRMRSLFFIPRRDSRG